MTEQEVRDVLLAGGGVYYHVWYFTINYYCCSEGCCDGNPDGIEEAMEIIRNFVGDDWDEVTAL